MRLKRICKHAWKRLVAMALVIAMLNTSVGPVSVQAEDIGEMTEAHAAELIVNFAAEKGYSFSMEELREFESETKELSREELDRINAADGIGKHGAFCRWYPWL